MSSSDLKTQVLREVSRKAYELQIKANLAAVGKMDYAELLAAERSIHHEIKRLRKLLRNFEKAKKRKERDDLEKLIYFELNHGLG